MIVDRSPLAGVEAYLRDGDETNLSGGARGTSSPLGDGMGLDVAGVHVLLQADDLGALFERSAGSLLRFRIRKKIFADLLADPLASRIHTIGGFEDMRRGRLRNMEPMDINGVATLVSVGEDPRCAWESAVYRMPAEGLEFGACGWDIAASNRVAAEAFTYSLHLRLWSGTDSAEITLAQDAAPQDPRARAPLALQAGDDSIRRVTAYQFLFEATVATDSEVFERERGAAAARPRGRPLLSAIHLVERSPSAFDFCSLREVTAAASSWHFLPRDGGAPRALVATIPLAARLGEGESVEVEARGGAFTLAQVRLEAVRLYRPPVAEQA